MLFKFILILGLLAISTKAEDAGINVYYSAITKSITLVNKNPEHIKWVSNPNNATYLALSKDSIEPHDGVMFDREYIYFLEKGDDTVNIKIHNQKLISYLEEALKSKAKITIILSIHIKNKGLLEVVSKSFNLQKMETKMEADK